MADPISSISGTDPTQTSNISADSGPRGPPVPDKYTVEKRPQDVVHFEYKTFEYLHEKITVVAPHMVDSFIFHQRWWDENSFRLGIQMFKYLLLRSLENTEYVFSTFKPTTEEPTVEECEKAIKAYNARAKRVWSQEADFMRRRHRCSAIYEQQVLALRPTQDRYSTSIPKHAVQEMDAVFKANYKTLAERLLLGRLDEIPQVINAVYAKQVASALGQIDKRYEARAILSLHPLYGRGTPLPLMTEESVEAMWQVCQSYYYTVQLNALCRWIEPFPEAMNQLGHHFTHSMHWFFRPKERHYRAVFSTFYQVLMELSPQFYVAGLLHEYLSQDTFVPGYVRKQLLTNIEHDAISEAFRKVKKRWRDLETDYDRFVNFSGLDWRDEDDTHDAIPLLRTAMFDLMLGDETRRINLNRYQEVHVVRNIVHGLLVELADLLHPRCEHGSLWWDEIKLDDSPRKQWVSQELAADPRFGELVSSWSMDSFRLRVWLRDYERRSVLKNNPQEEEEGIFSESSAIAIMAFAKVQADYLDRKRRLQFAELPRKLKDKCEQLGLFQARMPRFSQLFFYEFTDQEMLAQVGQDVEGGFSAPVRAARAYLQSGMRLESTCGISDIWYRHVQLNAKMFVHNPPNSSNLLPPTSAHPRPDEDQMRTREPMFGWEAFHHLRPKTPKNKSAKSTLPGSHVLVRSSSPHARDLGNTVPRAKRDRPGKKASKPRTVVSSKPKVGGPAAEGPSTDHTKTVGGAGLGKQNHDTKEEQAEKKRDAVGAKDSTGGGGGFETYEVDDWVPTSSFHEELNLWIDKIDSEAADTTKAKGKKRERPPDDEEISSFQPSTAQKRMAVELYANKQKTRK